MAIVRKKQKFGADEIAVAIDGFVTHDNRVIRRGGRLRGDDPLVRAHPHLFIEDGATDQEVGAARAASMDFLDSSVDPPPGPIAGPIPPERRRIVTRDAVYTLNDGSMWVLHAGDVADANDPRVKAADPSLFRKPTREEQNREEA